MDLRVDSHKLIYHPEVVSMWMMNPDEVLMYVEVGLTNYCNHTCSFCALDWVNSNTNHINTAELVGALESMASMGVKSVCFAGEGEPLLHPDITEIVMAAKGCGLDVAIMTNGTMLNESLIAALLFNLEWIRFSVNADENNYERIHGKDDYAKVIKNIEKAVEFKNKYEVPVTIGVQTVVMGDNIGYTREYVSRIKSLGVDNLQLKPYSHHPNSLHNDKGREVFNAGILNLEEFNDESFTVYCRNETKQRIDEGQTYSQCFGCSFIALVDCYGNIMPCNLFYADQSHHYGNIGDGFAKVWRSDRAQEIRDKLRVTKSCRPGCRMDAINKYLDNVANEKKVKHRNFI